MPSTGFKNRTLFIVLCIFTQTSVCDDDSDAEDGIVFEPDDSGAEDSMSIVFEPHVSDSDAEDGIVFEPDVSDAEDGIASEPDVSDAEDGIVFQPDVSDAEDGIVFEPDVSGQRFNQFSAAKAPRFLLYNVNYGEGFNLRRDVYMRVANLVKDLNKEEPWILVLPPWGRLYHWQAKDIKNQIKIPWSLFFDVFSLKQYVPVVEFQEFLAMSKEPEIEEIYYLQNYKDWDEWQEKMEFKPCNTENHYYWKNLETGYWESWFFGYEDHVYAKKFQCVSYMGHAGFLKPFLLKNTTAMSVMIERAETVLHDRFGDAHYWESRRSMVFSKALRVIGDEFRGKYLNSNDEADNTVLEDDWTKMKRKHGDASGGPYIAVHLRRKDFLRTSRNIPSIKHAARQLDDLLTKNNLTTVFVATDAPKEEYESLRDHLAEYEVLAFRPSKEVKDEYKEGGIAIIDQWICAHARYFIGTQESTFSFRIQEEREILGFDPEMTFNRLCDDEEELICEKPSQWTIVY